LHDKIKNHKNFDKRKKKIRNQKKNDQTEKILLIFYKLFLSLYDKIYGKAVYFSIKPILNDKIKK
jgi:hypothetical protein